MVDDLYVRHRAAIERVVQTIGTRFRLRDSDGDDFAQDARLHLLVRVLPAFDGRSALATYLWRATCNFAINWLEARRRQCWLTDARSVALPLDGLSLDSVRADGTPEEELIRVEKAAADRARLDHVASAVACLPPVDRVLLTLRYVEGLNVAAIAARTGLTPRAAYLRLYRIRDRVRRDVERVERESTQASSKGGRKEGRKEGNSDLSPGIRRQGLRLDYSVDWQAAKRDYRRQSVRCPRDSDQLAARPHFGHTKGREEHLVAQSEKRCAWSVPPDGPWRFRDSRRLHYLSTNSVDSGGSERTAVDTIFVDNSRSVSSCDHNLRPVS